MSVGNAECGSIQARLSLYGEERGADVRVEHRKLELQIVQSRVRWPSALRVVAGYLSL